VLVYNLCLVPYSTRVSGLTILLIASSVSCPVFYPCLWIDHSFDCLLCVLSRILPVFLDWPFFWLPPLCLVPYSTRVSGLTILLIASSVSCPVFYSCLSGLTIRLIASSVFSNIYLTNNHYQRTIFLLWVIQENILPESAIEKQDLTMYLYIFKLSHHSISVYNVKHISPRLSSWRRFFLINFWPTHTILTTWWLLSPK
jgi:hypothetical protein